MTRPSNIRTAVVTAASVAAAVVVNLAVPGGPPLALWSGPLETALRVVAAAAVGAVWCLVMASLVTPRRLPERVRLAIRGLRAPASGRFWLAGRACIEESVWRASLLPLLAMAFGVPVAVALSSVAFGIGHAHQGLRGVLANAVNGVAFAASYLALGGLPAAVATHAAHNLVLASILVGRRQLTGRPNVGRRGRAVTQLATGQ